MCVSPPFGRRRECVPPLFEEERGAFLPFGRGGAFLSLIQEEDGGVRFFSLFCEEGGAFLPFW